MAVSAADANVQAPVETPASPQDANPPTPADQNIQEAQTSINWWKIVQDCKKQCLEPLVKDLSPGTWG
eukprot:6854145-Pyramimonas_sp.AAC.1